MRKAMLIGLALVIATGTGCSLFKEKHVYQDAREMPPLKVPEGLDPPNPSAALAVPEVRHNGPLIQEVKAPGMAFQVHQSESGKVLIESQNDLPVLTYFGSAQAVREALHAMELPEGWQVASESGECDAALKFTDPKAKAASELGFFKRVFTRQGRVIDRSGEYQLQCQSVPGKTTLTMRTAQGEAPPALLVDDILGGLYQQLLKQEKTTDSGES